MIEKGFVDALRKTLLAFEGATVIRPNDSMTLGVPDLLAYIPVAQGTIGLGPPVVWGVAVEAKQLRPLMDDPWHRGRRTGRMLKHPFSGPQVALLRRLKKSGVDACGLVRVSTDTAFRFDPDDLCSKTGNFTHEEMVKFGSPVVRQHGVWPFWRQPYEHLPRSRHRNCPA